MNDTPQHEETRDQVGPGEDAVEQTSETTPQEAVESAVRPQDEANDPDGGTAQPVMPTFLTREEYELIGDDPEPLPQGFEIIEGGAGAPSPAPQPEEKAGDEASQADRIEASAASETHDDAAPSIGSFLTEGMDAVREVSAAKRAHADAREALEQLDESIASMQGELDHRCDVESRFESIMASETERRDGALSQAAAAESQQDVLQASIDRLKQELQEMRDADSKTERRLKAAVEAAEAKEASSRESGARLQRRLDDAKRGLEKAKTDKQSALDAAKLAVESAAARLDALRSEYTEVQRNPSANSAAYSVRSGELEMEISDAAQELRDAQASYPLIAEEVERNIRTAEKMLAEAKKPIDGAKRAHEAVTAEADEARDELDEAKKDAESRQRKLRDAIASTEKDLKKQQRISADAHEEAIDAQDLIDEAADIHAHPELTQALRDKLSLSRAERSARASEVEELAATERDVRERTRSSRIRLIAAIGAAIAIILIVSIAWIVLS